MNHNLLSVLLLSAIAFVSADDPEKLVGAKDAKPGQFPYAVSLRINGNHVCGGCIIGNFHVLTAAHCVKALEEVKAEVTVVSGSIYLNQGGEVHVVVSMKAHPEYNPNEATNDIGVLKVANPFVFNHFQKKIDLPNAKAPADRFAVVSAWGLMSSPPGGKLSSIQQYLHVKMISYEECKSSAPFSVQRKTICTFDGYGHGLCAGDSGSPLNYKGQVVGVVSRGVPCAQGYPDIFTSVYDHLSFIQESMGY